MKYRLLALDLDGTLLSSYNEITPETVRALQWAKQQGVYIVLATGRIVGEAAEFAREISCDDLMVCAGGAAIASASQERNLEEWAMPCEIGAQAVAAVQDLPVHVMIYVGDKVYINPFSDREFVQNYRYEGFHANKVVLKDIAGCIREREFPVTKIYARGERCVLDQALHIIRNLPKVTITSSGNDNFEVMPEGVNKGMALIRLGKRLGITPDQMVAVGDSDNDAAMLHVVGMPVAMGNAVPELKKFAKYIAADNDADGVAEVVYRFFQEGNK